MDVRHRDGGGSPMPSPRNAGIVVGSDVHQRLRTNSRDSFTPYVTLEQQYQQRPAGVTRTPVGAVNEDSADRQWHEIERFAESIISATLSGRSSESLLGELRARIRALRQQEDQRPQASLGRIQSLQSELEHSRADFKGLLSANTRLQKELDEARTALATMDTQLEEANRKLSVAGGDVNTTLSTSAGGESAGTADPLVGSFDATQQPALSTAPLSKAAVTVRIAGGGLLKIGEAAGLSELDPLDSSTDPVAPQAERVCSALEKASLARERAEQIIVEKTKRAAEVYLDGPANVEAVHRSSGSTEVVRRSSGNTEVVRRISGSTQPVTLVTQVSSADMQRLPAEVPTPSGRPNLGDQLRQLGDQLRQSQLGRSAQTVGDSHPSSSQPQQVGKSTSGEPSRMPSAPGMASQWLNNTPQSPTQQQPSASTNIQPGSPAVSRSASAALPQSGVHRVTDQPSSDDVQISTLGSPVQLGGGTVGFAATTTASSIHGQNKTILHPLKASPTSVTRLLSFEGQVHVNEAQKYFQDAVQENQKAAGSLPKVGKGVVFPSSTLEPNASVQWHASKPGSSAMSGQGIATGSVTTAFKSYSGEDFKMSRGSSASQLVRQSSHKSLSDKNSTVQAAMPISMNTGLSTAQNPGRGSFNLQQYEGLSLNGNIDQRRVASFRTS